MWSKVTFHSCFIFKHILHFSNLWSFEIVKSDTLKLQPETFRRNRDGYSSVLLSYYIQTNASLFFASDYGVLSLIYELWHLGHIFIN